MENIVIYDAAELINKLGEFTGAPKTEITEMLTVFGFFLNDGYVFMETKPVYLVINNRFERKQNPLSGLYEAIGRRYNKMESEVYNVMENVTNVVKDAVVWWERGMKDKFGENWDEGHSHAWYMKQNESNFNKIWEE